MEQPALAPRAVAYALSGVVGAYALVGVLLSQVFAPAGVEQMIILNLVRFFRVVGLDTSAW
eukprot:4352005-Prymnesium_polylepis.1